MCNLLPPPFLLLPPSPLTTLKSLKNDIHVNPHHVNDATNPSTLPPPCILLCKAPLYIVVSKGVPYHLSSITKVVIIFLLPSQLIQFLACCNPLTLLSLLMAVSASNYNPLSIDSTRYSVVLSDLHTKTPILKPILIPTD